MAVKRKSRNKLADKVDLLMPVNIENLGSENDPCFGKHFDPKHAVCIRCGDSELCQIIMQQRMHTTRGKIEAGGKFKDLEEAELYEHDIKELKKFVRSIIRSNKKILKSILIDQCRAKYPTYHKWEKLISKMIETTDKFQLKNQYLVWL